MFKKKPLISVIIPYYKKIQYFSNALNSVLNQSYKNFEIIIVYDDANQSDLKKIKSIIKNNKKIKILVNKKNLGAGQSRNQGIKISKGKYLAFIDSDDYWQKNKLSYQLKFMEEKKYSLTHTSYYIVNKTNHIISKRKAKKKLLYSDLVKSCDIGLSTVMIKKRILQNNKFGKTITKEDFSLWLKLTKKNIFYGLPKYKTKWKKLDDSLSNNTIQKLTDAFKIYFFQEKFNLFQSFYMTIILSINFIFKQIK